MRLVVTEISDIAMIVIEFIDGQIFHSSLQVNFSKFFSEIVINSAQSTSLNLIHDTEKTVELSTSVEIPPMEIQAYKLHTR